LQGNFGEARKQLDEKIDEYISSYYKPDKPVSQFYI
jgi:hypothetical protein